MNQKKKGHKEKERERVLYVKVVENNNKKLRRKNILLKYLAK